MPRQTEYKETVPKITRPWPRPYPKENNINNPIMPEHKLKDSDSVIANILYLLLLTAIMGFAGIVCYLVWMICNLIGSF
jgi:hypothetical protein